MKLKRIFSIVLSIMILAGALTQIIPASANTNGNSANEFFISSIAFLTVLTAVLWVVPSFSSLPLTLI